MFYLSLAIICSASIALIFKYTENSNAERYVITSANYFFACIMCLVMIISRGLLTGISRDISFWDDIRRLSTNKDLVLTPYSSIIWGVIVGVVAGVFFFLSFIYYQKSVKENGVGIAGTTIKLGILIPMLFSMIIWKEYPSSIQWLGIMLSLVSIVILNLSPRRLEKIDIKPTIILLFIYGGLAQFSNKFFQKYALDQYKDVFLFAVFCVAFLISIIYTLKQGGTVRKRDVLTGFVLGVPNLFASYFLILSLATVKTYVAFPLFSAGSIVLINLGGFFIFKEKIEKKNKVAILLTLIALVLINL